MTTNPSSEPNPWTDKDETNRIAILLIEEWVKAEGRPVNVSYIATFADMARRIVADQNERLVERERAAAAKAWDEGRDAAQLTFRQGYSIPPNPYRADVLERGER